MPPSERARILRRAVVILDVLIAFCLPPIVAAPLFRVHAPGVNLLLLLLANSS